MYTACDLISYIWSCTLKLAFVISVPGIEFVHSCNQVACFDIDFWLYIFYSVWRLDVNLLWHYCPCSFPGAYFDPTLSIATTTTWEQHVILKNINSMWISYLLNFVCELPSLVFVIIYAYFLTRSYLCVVLPVFSPLWLFRLPHDQAA